MCVCFHLLDLRVLGEPALLVVLSLVGHTPVNLSLTDSRVLALSDPAECLVFGNHVDVDGKATLLQRLEYILLVEVKKTLFEHVLWL